MQTSFIQLTVKSEHTGKTLETALTELLERFSFEATSVKVFGAFEEGQKVLVSPTDEAEDCFVEFVGVISHFENRKVYVKDGDGNVDEYYPNQIELVD